MNNWYVITGGPSTGKTKLVGELEKVGYTTISEAARALIDQALASGKAPEELRSDEKRFQEDVAKLKQKTESQLGAETTYIFDRGMHDTLAYLRHYGYEIPDWIMKLLATSTYKKVFLLDPLARYVKDYARTEDEYFSQAIPALLHEAYTEYGMDVIRVPDIGLEERKAFIIEHIG